MVKTFIFAARKADTNLKKKKKKEILLNNILFGHLWRTRHKSHSIFFLYIIYFCVIERVCGQMCVKWTRSVCLYVFVRVVAHQTRFAHFITFGLFFFYDPLGSSLDFID